MRKTDFLEFLDKLAEIYADCPARLSLVEELKEEFAKYGNTPTLVTIKLKRKYSQEVLYKVINQLGYNYFEEGNNTIRMISARFA